MPRFYHDDPAWSDVTPIPQLESGQVLAGISYTAEYSEAMSYLRAVMAANEYSTRVLDLTEHIISLNPAHYTVWLYRAQTLSALNRNLREEIKWLNPTALKHLKNYQIWHHRQTIIDRLGSCDGEQEFVEQMLEKDAKNYHVWSYRQWVVRRFGLFGDEGERKWCEGMMERDVRNNSVWNHRFFVVFGGLKGEVEEGLLKRELEYAQDAVRKAPQNECPWNYIRGVLRQAKKPMSTVKEFAKEFADLEKPDEVRSTHALDLLADIYEEEKKNDEAKTALDLLANKYDPIRAKYWEYRARSLDSAAVEA
ncbi:protein prenylyltransferase [Sporormia fimetaria CBS 119925]|uniref:Protein farnesyltransferase/geranylgeranyltransferase type-1 subunit alpha n=1 Tax=Sporormia fimetaria CBS 119925 TaxID=1340428 RepID=A0A6A6VJX4_9PLEO|nr:protein prenylyltransferase [Sporormia fimetaria CBS 119925]